MILEIKSSPEILQWMMVTESSPGDLTSPPPDCGPLCSVHPLAGEISFHLRKLKTPFFGQKCGIINEDRIEEIYTKAQAQQKRRLRNR